MAEPEQQGREVPDGTAARAGWARVARTGALASAALVCTGIVAMLLAALVGQRALSMPSLLLLVLGLSGLMAITAASRALRRIARTGVEVDRALARRPALAARLLVATGVLALGLSGVAFGGLMVALTANPRSLLPLAFGVVLVLVALALLLRLSRSMRAEPATAASAPIG
ncbi:hypothetical protein [Agrococcus sp. TSP3-2-1]|uniref:hypothetical protein n=1 Tax=Agrococcus sp. TSP3-2-1 TaxID=2804583 RepID=UPI003CEA9F68